MTDHGNWVQRPNDSQELLRLAERLDLHDPQPAPPRVDRYGLLRFRGQVVTLSPREARVARALAASDGSIVPVSRLVTVAWGDGAVRTAAVHTCIGVDPVRWTPDSGVRPEEGVRLGRPPRYPEEFRREAVQLVLASDESRTAVARRLGVNETTLRNWVAAQLAEEARQADPLAVTGSEFEELRRVRRENAELCTEREILRKAAADFAQETIRSAASGSSPSIETSTARRRPTCHRRGRYAQGFPRGLRSRKW